MLSKRKPSSCCPSLSEKERRRLGKQAARHRTRGVPSSDGGGSGRNGGELHRDKTWKEVTEKRRHRRFPEAVSVIPDPKRMTWSVVCLPWPSDKAVTDMSFQSGKSFVNFSTSSPERLPNSGKMKLRTASFSFGALPKFEGLRITCRAK